MSDSLNAAIPLIVIGLVLFVISLWLILRLRQSTQVTGDETEVRDVLDEGAAPAQRNQALIDSTPAALADTPVPAPAPKPDPVPASASAPTTTPQAAAQDDLTTIKGVGPKLVSILAEQGVTSFAQIANWTESDITEIDSKLGRFQGRIERDQWVEQAKLLLSKDKAAFSAKFGNNR